MAEVEKLILPPMPPGVSVEQILAAMAFHFLVKTVTIAKDDSLTSPDKRLEIEGVSMDVMALGTTLLAEAKGIELCKDAVEWVQCQIARTHDHFDEDDNG